MRPRVIARSWACTVLWLLATAPVAPAQTLAPGYDDRPARGAAAAQGAVIYTPGLVRDGAPIDAAPYAVDDLQAAGWDVFRFLRPAGETALDRAVAGLAEAMAGLRRDDYRRLVLVGQSFGGWISLAAARPENGPVHAVVALAPAAFGTRDESPDWTGNADRLYPLAETVAADRVVVVLFGDDPYDPGGRGDRLRGIFQRRGLPAAVIDGPHDLAGHNAGLTQAFARRFGPCLRDFIAAAAPPALFVCPDPSAARLAGFAAPADLPGGPGADADPGLMAMAGRWYGAYATGRDVLLLLAPSARTTASAVYAFGPVVRGVDSPGGYTRRRGHFDPTSGVLRFAEPEAGTVIECRLLAGDAMLLAIAGRSGGERLQTVLRRVE